MKSTLMAQIASLPDRENVVYEIFSGTNQVAEISNEPGIGLRIEIFTWTDGIWDLDLVQFQEIIENSRKRIGDDLDHKNTPTW